MNDHFWVEKVENSITKSWFKDKTSSKLVEFAPKTLNFIKMHGFLHFLLQPSNTFTQIYLP